MKKRLKRWSFHEKTLKKRLDPLKTFIKRIVFSLLPLLQKIFE